MAKKQSKIEHWQGVIADLTAKQKSLAEQRAELEAQRAEVLLPAETGDSAAAKKLQTIVSRIAGVESDQANVAGAIEQAQQKLARAEAQAAHEERRARAARVRGAANKIVEAAKVADESFATLVKALRVRSDAIRELVAEYGTQTPLTDRLTRSGALLRAGRYHGLHGFIDLPAWIGPHAHLMPLSDADAAMLAGFASLEEVPRNDNP